MEGHSNLVARAPRAAPVARAVPADLAASAAAAAPLSLLLPVGTAACTLLAIPGVFVGRSYPVCHQDSG